jgi:septation ring formation regulator EzrA
MAEISADLVYEVLKAVQNDISQVKNELRDVNGAINALRGHQISMQQDIHNIYPVLTRYDGRLDRIERRLELNDVPTLTA